MPLPAGAKNSFNQNKTLVLFINKWYNGGNKINEKVVKEIVPRNQDIFSNV